MSYLIRPQEVFGVIAATARDHAALHTQLTGASDQLAAAAEGAPGAPAVVAELDNFRAEHDRITALQETRVERAAHGCQEAIEAYHTGDQQMAEAFTRNSAALFGEPPRDPSSIHITPGGQPVPQPPAGPLPPVLQGD